MGVSLALRARTSLSGARAAASCARQAPSTPPKGRCRPMSALRARPGATIRSKVRVTARSVRQESFSRRRATRLAVMIVSRESSRVVGPRSVHVVQRGSFSRTAGKPTAKTAPQGNTGLGNARCMPAADRQVRDHAPLGLADVVATLSILQQHCPWAYSHYVSEVRRESARTFCSGEEWACALAGSLATPWHPALL